MRALPLTLFALLCASTAFAKEIKLPAETVMYPANTHPGYVTTLQKCLICHSADYALYQPNLSLDAWNKVAEKMRLTFKAPITQEEASQVAAYLFETQHPKK
jgi:hypothetical protein